MSVYSLLTREKTYYVESSELEISFNKIIEKVCGFLFCSFHFFLILKYA